MKKKRKLILSFHILINPIVLESFVHEYVHEILSFVHSSFRRYPKNKLMVTISTSPRPNWNLRILTELIVFESFVHEY